tara:strand:- start:162 stop:782 length:621 start_codon:yes stop_codon:yes gene_type:complete
MSEEIPEINGDEIDETVTDEPKVEYTKSGRVKKPRSQAQIDALLKAREVWKANQANRIVKREENKLQSLKEQVDTKKERVAKKAEIEVENKCKKAVARYEKQKKILSERVPVMPEVPENEVVPEVNEVPEPEPEPEPPVVVKKVRKKKPVVVVQDESESELESDSPHVIFVKRKAKPKEPVPDPRFEPKQTNPFSRPYFYNVGAMS